MCPGVVRRVLGSLGRVSAASWWILELSLQGLGQILRVDGSPSVLLDSIRCAEGGEVKRSWVLCCRPKNSPTRMCTRLSRKS